MPLITDLSVRGFRGLQHIKLEGLGRVNLITGQNNSGKSSLLEALRIFAANAAPQVLASILHLREEDTTDVLESVQHVDADSLFPWSNLFTDFPKFTPAIEAIEIAGSLQGRLAATRLECAVLGNGQEGFATTQLREGGLDYGGLGGEPGLVITADGQRFALTLERMMRSINRPLSIVAPALEQRMTCAFVSPYGAERTDSLAKLWDAIALSEQEQAVVDALSIIDSRIRAVSMIGGATQGMRTAVVKADGLTRRVPLRTFGDGVNRVFGIVLSLVNVADGLLLIDEFENGMHYSVLTDVWRVIFAAAERANVQVFATSHSWDAIEAFQKVASDHTAQGTLIRLVRRDNQVIPTIFSEDELEIITRANIEVR